MLNRILSAGLVAGVLAGVFTAGLQHVTTTPLILKAETYEGQQAPAAAHQHSSLRSFNGVPVILAHAPAADAAVAGEHPEAWAPADGIERTLYTTTATVGTGVGFALMLLALMIASGAPVTASSAALWGAAGFVATGLAPSLGLAPELPGSAAGDIVLRQLWWIATAAATAGGLWVIWRSRTFAATIIGLAVIVVPHLIGAPHPAAFSSTVPAELAAHFASTSLVVHAVLWVMVGALAGYVFDRQSAATAA